MRPVNGFLAGYIVGTLMLYSLNEPMPRRRVVELSPGLDRETSASPEELAEQVPIWC